MIFQISKVFLSFIRCNLVYFILYVDFRELGWETIVVLVILTTVQHGNVIIGVNINFSNNCIM